MFKHEGALYLLVTDQGYMREGQVRRPTYSQALQCCEG